MPDSRGDEDPRLRQLVNEQAALRRVATLVARGVSPDELFSEVSNEVGRLFGSDQAAIGRYEPDGSSVVYVGISQGLSMMPVGTRWPLEDFLASTTVYRTGRPARQEQSDYDTASGQVAETLRELNTVSRVGAPIFVEGNLWGVLLVTDTRERLPPDTEERLASFTELIATAIANAESRAELASSEARAHDLAREQAALRRVATLVAEGTSADELFSAVTKEIGRLFGAHVGISRFEPDGSAMVVVGLTAGIPTISIGTRFELDEILASTAVYRTGRPARNDHTRHRTASGRVADSLRQMNFTSTVAVPIVVEGKVWGALAVSDQREQLPPDTEERVAKFTGLVATAIANAESRAALDKLVEEQAALRRVATLVAQGGAPVEIFSAVSEEVAALSAGRHSSVARFEPDGSDLVVVGTNEDNPISAVGARWDLDDFLASTTVYRTGRAARSDHAGARDASGVGADRLREIGFLSTVAVPITVQEKLWGVVTVSDSHEQLPSGTEKRIAKFAELVAAAIANVESRTALASSERRAHELAQEQAALRRVATLVAEGASPDELFGAVSEEVAALFGSEAGVARFEPDGSALVFVGLTKGIRGLRIGSSWPLEAFAASSQVYRTGRPARSDPDDWRKVSGPAGEAIRENSLVSNVSAPIVVDGKPWGAISVADRRQPLPPGAEGRVAKFTELVATAIANTESRAALAASEARAHHLAGEQAALRRVATLVAQGASSHDLFAAVAREVADVLGIPVVGLHRFEADGTFTMMGIAGETSFTVGSRWPVEDEGLAGMILAGGSPARKDDYAAMPGPLGEAVRDDTMISTVGVPIVVEGDIWGFMVGAARPGKPIANGIEQRLARFTELVATAIANSQARAHLAQLADEQAALRRVATLVAQGVSPDEVFSVVCNEVGRLFGSEQVSVGRYEPDGSGVVFVGFSQGMRGVAIGTRWPLEDFLALTTVYRTGRSATRERSDYEDVSGPIADSLREMNFVSRIAAPIIVEGNLWGVMTVNDAHERLVPDAEERLANFTGLVATAIANADSRAELAASRARVIAAADDARRRIERDLHDGAQQRLVTLSVALRTIVTTVPAGSERGEVARIADGLAAAVQELRELSRGIHPAVLTQGGLAPALKALRRRSPVRVTLDIRFEGRLPDQVEAAAYYTVSEALTNASRHAGATRVWVEVQITNGTLHLVIRDDGVGGADPSRGSGLTGLKDRIEALGGRIHIDSAPGRGTHIDVEIPIFGPLQSRSDFNEPLDEHPPLVDRR
jgi:GAF domain-containing protein